MEDVSVVTGTATLTIAINDEETMRKDVQEHISNYYVPKFLFQHVIHDYKDAYTKRMLSENGDFATHFVDTMTSPTCDRLSGKHIILTATLEDKRTYFRQLWRMALKMKRGGISNALIKKKTAVYSSMCTRFKSKFQTIICKMFNCFLMFVQPMKILFT